MTRLNDRRTGRDGKGRPATQPKPSPVFETEAGPLEVPAAPKTQIIDLGAAFASPREPSEERKSKSKAPLALALALVEDEQGDDGDEAPMFDPDGPEEQALTETEALSEVKRVLQTLLFGASLGDSSEAPDVAFDDLGESGPMGHHTDGQVILNIAHPWVALTRSESPFAVATIAVVVIAASLQETAAGQRRMSFASTILQRMLGTLWQ